MTHKIININTLNNKYIIKDKKKTIRFIEK